MWAGMQADLVTLMSRQPRALATRWTAGNQLSAWLSPNRTIVVLERGLPYMHRDDSGAAQ
jgi:hypothetical protein